MNYNSDPPSCYFVYIDVTNLGERTLLRARTVEEIESQIDEIEWRRAKYQMVFRRRRNVRLPARYR